MSTTDNGGFEVRAVAVALHNMFRGNHFSICTVDDALRALRLPEPAGYNSLRLLHCVRWQDMPQGMAEEVRGRVIAALSAVPIDIQAILAELQAPPKPREAKVAGGVLARIRGAIS